MVRHAVVVPILRRVRRETVVAHHPEHRLGVLVVAGERSEHRCHLRRRRIRVTGEDRGEGPGEGTTLVRVVRDATAHLQRTQVGVAESERAVVVRALSDLLRREVRHRHRDLQHHRPQADGVLVGLDVEGLCLVVVELHQIEAGEVARRVVEEHVLRARVGGVDATAGRARVPLVDGRVVLHARIGACPRGLGDLTPDVAGLDRLHDRALDTADQVPVLVVLDGAQEVLAHPHRVVRVLAGDRLVGLAVEVRGVAGRDERADLVLLDLLPVDELLDVRVVDVEDHHLGGAAGGAARLDRTGGAVADL